MEVEEGREGEGKRRVNAGEGNGSKGRGQPPLPQIFWPGTAPGTKGSCSDSGSVVKWIS